MKRVARGVAIVAAMLLAAGCAHQNGQARAGQDNLPVYSPSRHGGTDAQAQYGVVSAIQAVEGGKGNASGMGAALGAVAGAVIGRQFGDSRDGRAQGTMIGAIGGAFIGHEMEKDQTGRRTAVRVSVQLERGGARTFEFGSVGDLRVGDRVRVEGNQLYRL